MSGLPFAAAAALIVAAAVVSLAVGNEIGWKTGEDRPGESMNMGSPVIKEARPGVSHGLEPKTSRAAVPS